MRVGGTFNVPIIIDSFTSECHIVYNTDNREYLLTFMSGVLFRQLHICVFDTIKFDVFDLYHSTKFL